MRAPALVCGGERIGHDELWERVGRLAGALAARGLGPGDAVALVLPNGPAFVTGFLAVAQLRGVVVPLNPQFKRPELAFYLRDSGVRAVLTDAAGARLCADLGVPVIADADRLIAAQPELAPVPGAADDTLLLAYSSGSTGRAKCVPRSTGQLRWEAESVVAAMELTAADAIFCSIPMFHAYGLGCCLLAAVRSGATLVISDPGVPLALGRQHTLEMLERERVTVMPAVPFALRVLAESGGGDLGAVRLCFSAGNALPRSTFDAFDRAFGIPIRQLYGLTETGAVTINLDEDPWATAASVGRPMPGIGVDILDEAGDPVEGGRIGDIAISSPAMTRRHGARLLTGDRGRLDEAGRLVITGRRKLLIDVSGDKVDPIEVEDVLAVHPKVREVVVVGVPSSIDGEELIKAVVVGEATCGERELIRFCRERLANYKVPHMVEFRDEIPRSSLGKVLRKYLV